MSFDSSPEEKGIKRLRSALENYELNVARNVKSTFASFKC